MAEEKYVEKIYKKKDDGTEGTIDSFPIKLSAENVYYDLGKDTENKTMNIYSAKSFFDNYLNFMNTVPKIWYGDTFPDKTGQMTGGTASSGQYKFFINTNEIS